MKDATKIASLQTELQALFQQHEQLTKSIQKLDAQITQKIGELPGVTVIPSRGDDK